MYLTAGPISNQPITKTQIQQHSPTYVKYTIASLPLFFGTVYFAVASSTTYLRIFQPSRFSSIHCTLSLDMLDTTSVFEGHDFVFVIEVDLRLPAGEYTVMFRKMTVVRMPARTKRARRKERRPRPWNRELIFVATSPILTIE